MSVYQKSRNGVAQGPFQYIHEVCGQRSVGSTGCYDRAEAERFERRVRVRFEKEVRARKEAEEEARRQTAARARDPIFTLGAAATAYKDYVRVMGLKSAEWIGRDVDRLVAMLGPDKMLTSIDNREVHNLLKQARELTRGKRKNDSTKLKNSAINSGFIHRLRCLLNHMKAVYKAVLPYEPDWSMYILNEDNVRMRYLSFAESSRLDEVLMESYPDFYPIDRFARLTGLRLANLVGLTWDQIDWDKSEIQVVVKGGFQHTLPISDEIEQLLKPLVGDHDVAVFTAKAKVSRRNWVDGVQRWSGTRYPIGREAYKAISRAAFARAGIDDGYCIHAHRHTAATWLYAATRSLVAVQMLLGHRDIRMARRYAKADLRDLRAAMDAVAAERVRAQVRLQMRAQMLPAAHC